MTTDLQLVHFDRARQALAEAHSIDEVKQIRDQAEAIRAYIKQQKGSFEMQNQAAEIKLRAERRVGMMLKETELNKGSQSKIQQHLTGGLTIQPPAELPKLEDLGISKDQSHRWQLEAQIPEARFEQFIVETTMAAEELTSRAAFAIAQKIQREERIKETAPFPDGKFQVIYADPPWQYNNTGLGGSAESHYPTLPIADLEGLKDRASRQVTDLPGDNAVLFLWATAPFAPEGLQLCEAWGFEYKTHFVWIKDKSTYGKLGFYVYSQHELLLVATKGSCLPQDGSLAPSIIVAPKEDHSAKPKLVYEIIEKMYTGPYIELFARKRRVNWEAWGTL